MDVKYEGSFKVVNCTANSAYVLRDFNDAILPKNYTPEQLKLVTRDEAETGRSYEIEAILDDDFDQKTREKLYLMKRKEYNERMPYDNFDSKLS
ncbi:hypothetical protein DFQ26_000970 [Actinomortierella ambigua]|nr:hypothetical protein DFQ26_000970 [Actinomortierella ambigua]